MFEADHVKVTMLVEAWIDILISDEENVTRSDLLYHFDRNTKALQAENGFSMLIEVTAGRRTSKILFDCGLTPEVILHNLDALKIDPAEIDQIVISHGHLDHHGGMEGLLEHIPHPIPVIVHPDAFKPRYLISPDGGVSSFYNVPLDRDVLEAAGARFVLSRSPMPIGPGTLTTGEIARDTPFEGPTPRGGNVEYGPGIYQLDGETLDLDEVWDEVGIVANVKGEGLVVITGCGHAGVVNTINTAKKITGVEELALVMGGFHLGFPGTPYERVVDTVNALKELAPRQIAPMHCSGLACISLVASEMPDQFFQYSVGTRVEVGSAA